MDKDLMLLIIASLFGTGGVVTLFVKSFLDRRANKKESKVVVDALMGLQDKVVDMSKDLMDVKNMKKFDIKLQNTIQKIKDDYSQMMDLVSYSNGNQYNNIVKFWSNRIEQYSTFFFYSDVRKSKVQKDVGNFLRREMLVCEKELTDFIKLNLTELRLKGKGEIHFIDIIDPNFSKVYTINQSFIEVLIRNGLDYDKFSEEVRFYLEEFFDELLNNIKLFREAKVLTENDI